VAEQEPGDPAGWEASAVEGEAAEESEGLAGEEEVGTDWFAIPDRPEVLDVVAEWSGGRRRLTLDSALRRGERYLPMIREIFREEGVPEDLAYLALVESHFHQDARSPAAALGLWQFIESTGRACGLRIDWWVDERLDPEASTRAAALHLKELYERFQDWELALAAYNAGPNGLERAIRRGAGSDFWELAEGRVLRAETRRYVPKFYAALHLARSSEAGAGEELAPVEPLRYDIVRIDSPVDLRTVARAAGVPAARLRELNPALRRGCTPPSEEPFELRVPEGSGEAVGAALAKIPPSQRLDFVRYRLKPGDTLWGISRRYGAPVAAIMELNALRDARRLRPGNELVLPVPSGRSGTVAAARAPSGPVRPEPGVHVVAAGETVWSIARRHGVAVRDVLQWNRLGSSAVVRPGDRLRVTGPQAARRGAPAGSEVHVVSRGESLWAIARRYGLSLEELLERSGLSASSVLRPGDRIVVGAGSGGGVGGLLN
jgi:membrane-bound lytic murein transglycosylase D